LDSPDRLFRESYAPLARASRSALTRVAAGPYNRAHVFTDVGRVLRPVVPGRLVTRDDRTGSIVLEEVTQRFPLPREEREFIALQGVSFEVRGGEFVSIVLVMVVSLVFFVVFFSTYTGIREVDRDLVNNARILEANPRHMIRHVLLPSALTWIFSSLRTSDRRITRTTRA
jgi:Binding-protein-dependent transport system inner membrane component